VDTQRVLTTESCALSPDRCAAPDDAAAGERETLRGQKLIDYIGANLRVNYVLDNGVRRIRLTNSGSSNIPPDEQWVIYFNHATGLSSQALLKLQGLRMFHVDGWLNGIETVVDDGWTTIKFRGIPAGESLVLLCSASVKTRSYAFPRYSDIFCQK